MLHQFSVMKLCKKANVRERKTKRKRKVRSPEGAADLTHYDAVLSLRISSIMALNWLESISPRRSREK